MARVFGGSFSGFSLCLSVEGLWYESRACAVNLVNSAQCQPWESTEFCQLDPGLLSPALARRLVYVGAFTHTHLCWGQNSGPYMSDKRCTVELTRPLICS